MVRNINTQSLLARANNSRRASTSNRESVNNEAGRRFDSEILGVEELLLALQTTAPNGAGAWYFPESFKGSIAKCESLNKSRKYQEAWSLLIELRAELIECLTEAPVFEAPVFETPVFEAPVFEAPVVVSHRQRKQAKKTLKMVARNEGKTLAEAKTGLGELLRKALAT